MTKPGLRFLVTGLANLSIIASSTNLAETYLRAKKNLKVANKSINLCTGSQALLRALKSLSFTSYLMIEYLISIGELSEKNNVNLIWD